MTSASCTRDWHIDGALRRRRDQVHTDTNSQMRHTAPLPRTLQQNTRHLAALE